jgi:hypothetical protein
MKQEAVHGPVTARADQQDSLSTGFSRFAAREARLQKASRAGRVVETSLVSSVPRRSIEVLIVRLISHKATGQHDIFVTEHGGS